MFDWFFGVILVGEVHIGAKKTREAHPYGNRNGPADNHGE